LDTLLIHADAGIEDTPDMAPPIHMATTFKYVNTNNPEDYLYTRFDQPTRKRLEKVLGALEGGHCIVYTSGSSAGLAALNYYRPGRVWINRGYMGSHATLQAYFSPIDQQWYKNCILTLKEDIIPEPKDLIWLETPKNPHCEIEDISHYAALAKRYGAYIMVDSTFATPILQQPLKYGVDLVMHSCTKFISGHSDVLAGALVSKYEHVAAGLKSQRTVTGAVLGNLECYLLLRSVRELSIRVERQVKNAIAVAAFLHGHKNVAKVYHPSLESDPGYQLCAKQMKSPPAIMSLQLKEEESVKTLLTSLKIISCATSLGGVHTSIDWRYKFDSKVDPTILRLSIGIESKKDIIQDLDQALNKL